MTAEEFIDLYSDYRKAAKRHYEAWHLYINDPIIGVEKYQTRSYKMWAAAFSESERLFKRLESAYEELFPVSENDLDWLT